MQKFVINTILLQMVIKRRKSNLLHRIVYSEVTMKNSPSDLKAVKSFKFSSI